MIRRCLARFQQSLAWLGLALLGCQTAWALDVTTFHYDNQRTGANTAETVLNQSNVSALTFGKLYERSVIGDIFAQPLYISGLTIGGGTHNVIYVATENNYVYCFDADNGATAAYWTRSDLGDPAPRIDIIPGDTNYNTVIGITSTPVIDRATGTIYSVSMNKDAPGDFKFRLWAMDLATGANKTGSPMVITATNFDPVFQAQRAALTLANGKIYVTFASFSDKKPYSGYIISYNPATLAKVNEFLTGPSCVGAGNNGDFGSGIWMSGCGPAVDADGNLYVVTGNGTVNTTNALVGGTNYGESIIKLDPNLAVVDFYTPQNRDYLNAVDADLGVGGLVVLPDQPGTHTHLVIHTSKEGKLYIEDRDNLGKYVAGADNVVQISQPFGGNIKATPIYWVDPSNNNRIFAAAEENQPIKSFVITNTGALDLVNNVVQSPNFRGTQMSLSSNGKTAGTGVLWAFSPTIGDPVHGIGPGVLHAYNAETLAELYNSTTNSIRDALGNYPKNCPPLVVNGKVYAATFADSGTFTNKLCVYGQLPTNGTLAVTITSPTTNTTTALEPVSVTITANATIGTGTIAKVSFYQGTSLLGEDTSAPYGITWTATAGTYALTALATDNNGASVASTVVNITVPGRGAGTILHQMWTGINGVLVSDLTANGNFPNAPTSYDYPTLAEGPTDTADAYGSRIIGYLYPPVTGQYTFWVASDDNSELWLSTDTNPTNRVKIATVPDWTGPREWEKFILAGQQRSGLIDLVGGQIYFFEALQKEGGGGDNFAVGWNIPTTVATLERPILGVHMSPPALPPTVNPPAGTYSGPVTVHLAEAIPGLTIHYTTDNSTPTVASPTYTTPFVVPGNSTMTVKAVAVMVDNNTTASPARAGTITSQVTTAVFTVTGNTAYGLPERPALTGVNLPANLGTNPPALLSQTGLFSNVATLTPAAGVIPYDVISPLWSDGANKDRWIALPTNSTITFKDTGEFVFPSGTVLIKNFKVGAQRLELRLLVLNGANAGYGITYKWNAGGTEANLMGPGGSQPDGLNEVVGSQTWHYPSRSECLSCHTATASFVLGPKTRQLNGTFAYPGGATDNQLRTWSYLQMFSNPPAEGSIAGLTKMVSVSDTTATLETRVRSYIDSNCSQCHRPVGVDAYWDGRFDTAIGSQGIIDGTVRTTLGVVGAEVVRPQSLSQSLMHVRMSSVDNTIKMPPLARNLIDTNAVSVLDAWIASLTPASTAPVEPSSLTATTMSTTQINLAWIDNANNETGFRIERKTGAGGTYAEITVTGGNLTAFNDTGLTAGTLYYYRLRATNGAGNSVYSNEVSATTSAASTAPAAPSTLTATASSTTQIDLAWTDNANNETGFRIERKTGAGGTYAEITVAGANLTTFSDTGLTAGTLYSYRLRSTNGLGDSAYSNEASATTSSASGGGGSTSSGGGGGGCGLGAAATAMLLGFAWILGRQLQLRSGR